MKMRPKIDQNPIRTFKIDDILKQHLEEKKSSKLLVIHTIKSNKTDLKR